MTNLTFLGLTCIVIPILIHLMFELKQVSEKLNELLGKPDRTATPATVTMGQYAPVNENAVNTSSDVGLVTSKTPQLVEFEEQENLRKIGLGIK